MEDDAIIERVRNGDPEAFSLLVRRHQQMVFAVAMSVAKQEADARDAVQQGFLQAFLALRSFRGEASFSSWLCRIVINEALRGARRRQRTVTGEWPPADAAELGAAENDALAALHRADRRRLIREVFARMPPREALVLHLFYLEEQSVRETAYCTDLTANHVKVLLSRGRKRFLTLCRDHPGAHSLTDPP